MTFDLVKLKQWMTEAHDVLGHPLAKMALPIVLGLLPKFGSISEKDLAGLEADLQALSAMKAEAKRRAGTALDD